VTAAPIDLTTYAGVAPLNAELNDALTQFAASQASLNTICAAAGNATTIAAASGDRGAAGQIVLVDAALTKLDAAQADLDRWLAAPLPSATPSPIPATSTATALPSATSLPPTAGPSPTSTWTPLPSATVTATTIPISPTTLPNTLIPSATALSTTQLTGLGLASLHSYSYVLTVISTGTRSGQPINRSLTVKALRLATPLTDKAQAQYTIGLTEDVPWLQPLDLLYQPGQVEHVLLNGSYYFDTLQPPGIACQVVPSTNRAAPLEAIDPNAFLKPLFGVTLTRTGQDEIVSGLAAHHYHAEQTVGVAPNATTLIYDVFISTDARQLPLRVVYSVNGAVTNALIGLTNAPIPKTDQVISYSASFTLAQIDPTLTIQPPTECPAK